MPKSVPAFSEIMRGYGPRLVAARKALGLKANELARLLNVTPQRLSHWENERHPPPIEAMLALKHLRGVTTDWIYSGDPNGLPMSILQPMITLGAADDAAPDLVRLRAAFNAPGGPPGLHERVQRGPV
jgi:transcriptional regulator with XRE-family HTH domain